MQAPPPFLGEGVGGRGSSRRLALVLVAVVGAFAFAILYFALRQRDDASRFQGEWRLTLAEREKQPPITVRVTGDRWVWLVGDKPQNRYTMTLRPDANPKEIDLVQLAPNDNPRLEKRVGEEFTPVTLRGIYLIQDGTVKLLVAPNPLPRPTSFDATDGDPVWLLERPW